MAEPTYLFLLGSGRCGSTLLHKLLAGHPEVGFISAADERLRRLDPKGAWNGRIYRRRVPVPGWVRGRYKPDEAYHLLDDQISPILSTPFRDLTAADVTPWLEERFQSFFSERARAQGGSVFMHKFTGWSRAGFVDRILPNARFVHVVRDGRAVANSLLQMPWWHGYKGPTEWTFGPLPETYAAEWEETGCSFPALAGMEWKLLLDAADRAQEGIAADRWMEVRYEDLVADHRRWLGDILAFAGLGWDERFERHLAEYPIRSGRSEAFRRELGTRDVEQLGGVLRSHLEPRGYSVDG